MKLIRGDGSDGRGGGGGNGDAVDVVLANSIYSFSLLSYARQRPKANKR